MSRTVCIIQARMGSTRLPGKVLMNLAGHPVLWHVATRVRACRALDDVVVATSTLPGDDAIADACAQWKIPCFRGDERDVLARYHAAAQAHRAERVMRVTADCPLIDRYILGALLAEWDRLEAGGHAPDYLSNTLRARTFPQGLDAELFSFAALETATREATDPYEREHVTPYFYRHPECFRLAAFSGSPDRSVHRWTLDTPEDYAFLAAIYDALYREGTLFTTDDVLALLDAHPSLIHLNPPQ